MTQAAQTQAVAASRYNLLTSERDHFLTRADKAAKLTIPTLFQKDMQTAKNMNIVDPAQSSGARGVNTLASKMVLSLLPTNTAFFKLNVDELMLQLDPEEKDKTLKTEIEKGLGVIERQALRDVENSGDVTITFEAIKHLIVTGNALLYIGEKATRLYNLNKFVVLRDPDGLWREIVVCEEVAIASLNPALRELLNSDTTQPGDKTSPEATVKLYTYVKRDGGKVRWHQELQDKVVPGSESEVPEEGNPWLPLRFLRVDGESYGRSYVDMYMGDLDNLEVLTKAVTGAAAAASKVLYLVRPNGTTNAKVIAKAPNMAVRSGTADDVTVLRLDKAADLAFAQNMITTIERRLAYAFMISGEVMRDAERVTAEEVRYIAQELDDSLGGIYSLLSQDFQLPYVKRRLHLMRKQSRIPKLPKEVTPVVVTGFAALGRGHDIEKLMRFLEVAERISAIQMPELNKTEAIARAAVALGIDTKGLILLPDETQGVKAEGQMMGMMEKLGPEAIRQLGGMAQTQMKEGGPNGTSQEPAQAGS